MEALYTEQALKDLRKLPKQSAKRILEKLKFFREQENPLTFAKKLTDSKYGDYRFRIGNYRIIFDLGSKNQIQVLLILRVKHRKEAYD